MLEMSDSFSHCVYMTAIPHVTGERGSVVWECLAWARTPFVSIHQYSRPAYVDTHTNTDRQTHVYRHTHIWTHTDTCTGKHRHAHMDTHARAHTHVHGNSCRESCNTPTAISGGLSHNATHSHSQDKLECEPLTARLLPQVF